MRTIPHLAGIRRSLLVIALIAFLSALVWIRAAQAQSGVCRSSTKGSYTITVCITAPANGATVSGQTTVTATTSISGSSSGVASLLFSLDGSYLLTDFEAPYTFQLPTSTFASGSHTLSVYASMRDGFASSSPTLMLNFSNAGTPTPGPSFVPVTPGARPAGQSLIMAAVGDGAGGESKAGQVTSMIDGWNPDLFLYLGDVYNKGTFSEFYNWYGQSNFHYGLFRDVTNPAIGNHEYENGVAPGYFQYWNNVPNYYSYNAGGWHFIALNSTSEYNQTGTSSPQYQWLLSDLAANTAPCTIAYWHHPILSVGPQSNTPRMNAIWNQLVQAGTDIVLTGHDHSYQRWVPLDGNLNASATGATHFVSGAGGHGVQGAVRTDNRLVVMYGNPANSYGAMYFKLNPKGAEYRYYNTARQLLDQGVVACSGVTDTAAPTVPTGLAATTSASGHVQLTWNAAWDETGVVGYDIYRDDVLIATIGGAEVSYVDMNVGLDVTYNYQVDAVDLGGRRSARSNNAAITRPGQITLIFTPVGDTYVQADVATTNYGMAATLKVDASPDTQSFLRFNLQGLAGSVVNSAALRLYTNSASSIGFGAFSLTGSWDETTTTYSNKPAAGSQVGTSGGYASGAWAQANVLPLVTGDGQLNLALKTTSNTSLSYQSRQGANPPQLVVNITSAQQSPTATPTGTPTPLPPTSTPTATNTPTATDTPVPPATSTPADTSTPTATNTPAALPTDTPTATPTATAIATAPPATLTFAPVADAYVRETKPTTNYGAATNLRVDRFNPIEKSYLRFNVEGITAPVTRASLRVYALSASSAGYEVRSLNGNWTETTVNYNTAVISGTAPSGFSGSVTTNNWTDVNVTSLVQGNGIIDMVMGPLSDTAINFSSREGANPPQLVVEFGGSAPAAASPDVLRGRGELPTGSGGSGGNVDSDGDGVSDPDELLNGSNPNSADTDGDGLLDLWEIEAGLSPIDATGNNGAQGDPDGDGIANFAEQLNATDPLNGVEAQPANGAIQIFLPIVGKE